MIKQIHSNGRFLDVSGGSSPGVYVSPNSVGSGHLRWNSNANEIEVNDGVTWRTLGSNSTFIGLSSDAQDAIAWALHKMQQEKKIDQLCEQHPGIADLKQKLDLMIKLVQDHADKP